MVPFLLKAILILLIITVSLWVCVNYYLGSPRYKGSASDHFDGYKFRNIESSYRKGFFDVLKWRFSSRRIPWNPPDEAIIPGAPEKPGPDEVIVTWVNHSTILIQTTTAAILIDPVWSERVGPFSWLGPKRVHASGIGFEQLPQINAVLVSHDHYDHLDLPTLRKLAASFNPKFITGLGNGAWMKQAGAQKVHELDWWQEEIIDSARVTFIPVKHWSGRSFTDRLNTLWGGFTIELNGVRILALSDTGFSTQLFTLLAEKTGNADICLLPIGAYEPRWFMKQNHLNPEEAVEAAAILGCKRAVAIHFGTFQLSDEGREDPTQTLARILAEEPHREVSMEVLKPGGFIKLKLATGSTAVQS